MLGEVDCITFSERYITETCATSGCHTAVDAEADLNLEAEGRRSRLVGVSGSECDGLLIDPEIPEESLLYTKVAPEPQCGDRMPLLDRAATEQELQCLLEWIAHQGTLAASP